MKKTEFFVAVGMVGLLAQSAMAFPKPEIPKSLLKAEQAHTLQSCANFAGTFTGSCTDYQGKITSTSPLVISQTDCTAVTSDGETLQVGAMVSKSSSATNSGVNEYSALSEAIDWNADGSILAINFIDIFKYGSNEPGLLPVRGTLRYSGSNLVLNYTMDGQSLLNCVYNRQ